MNRKLPPFITPLVFPVTVSLAAAFIPVAFAAEVSEKTLWKLCQPDSNLAPEASGWDTPLDAGTASINADTIEVTDDGQTTLTGDVRLRQDDQTMHADQVHYDESQSNLKADGNVQLWSEGLYWEGEHLQIDRENNTSHFQNGDYRLVKKRGHGHAEEVIDEPDNDLTYLKNLEYTTCETNIPAWSLKAKDLKLDHEANWGRALHTFLRIRDVPVFYLPYLSFPLTDERMSGFLPMTIGSTKDSGFDIRTPYYWNISSNQDATFTPRVLGDRGVMLGAEYRYLLNDGSGILQGEYLPSDNHANQENRYLLNVGMQQYFAQRKGRLIINVKHISDQQYFEDLSTSLDVTSQRLLDRRIDLSYTGSWWSLFGRIQSHQTIDTSLAISSQPYQRLPQFIFTTRWPEKNHQLNFRFRGEAVYFDREASIRGARFDFTPEISYPIRTAGSFFTPRLKLRHTQYSLDRNDGLNSSPDRTLPVFSLDSGLFFEKDLTLGNSSYLHTLEPRLFYLYIPETDQDDIPIFDTGRYDTSFYTLFRDDRFNAADRIGDANQLTAALTTRLIDKTSGREKFSASLGQIQYFSDRHVGLPGQTVETTSSSDIVAQVAAQLTENWSGRYDLQWDPHTDQTDKASVLLRYQPGRDTVVNLAYRMRRAGTDIEQADVSAHWPLNPNWSLVGRWNYSLQNDRTLESLIGVEYNSCCWATRIIGRRFLRNTLGEYDNAIFLQFELKGLGGFGRSARDFIQKNVPGYHNEF